MRTNQPSLLYFTDLALIKFISIRWIAKTSLIVISFLFLLDEAHGQASLMGGVNYGGVINNNIIRNQDPIFMWHAGFSYQWHPNEKWNKLTIQNELLFIRTGYEQNLDKKYNFNFNYISLPILANYFIFKSVSLNAGIELKKLYSTNQNHGNETYSSFDVGAIFGISLFENSRVNIYTRFTYGLVPMLSYSSIDKLGNFEGRIHDFHNTCIMTGLKIKLFDEKTSLFK